MWDWLLPPAILGVWLLVNVWLLPRLGIPTCLSGGCAAARGRRPSRIGPETGPGSPDPATSET